MSKPWAIITGASAGVGKATALALAKSGWNTYLLARREDRLKILAEEIRALGREAKIAVVDVRDPAQIDDFIQSEGSNLSRVEVLVNNAGLAKGTEKMQDAKIADWDEMIDTNVKGLLAMTRGVLPFFVAAKKGHVINLGSVAGRWTYPGGSVYCATKFAVRAISEGLRMDVHGTGVRVTNIEPGMVETEFSMVRFGDAKKAEQVYAGMTPLTADDIAETIVWCAQRPARVNVQELVIYPTDQAAVGMVHRR